MNPDYMREALELARQGRGMASPNPMVGAVVVRQGLVVGRGYHTYAGVRHAEAVALAERALALDPQNVRLDVRHSGALFASRSHAALRGCDHRCRCRVRDRPVRRSQSLGFGRWF